MVNMTNDISTSRSAWGVSVIETPGDHYVRETRAAFDRTPCALQLEVLGLPADASDDAFEQARESWEVSARNCGEMMDIVGATTPEGTLLAMRRLKEEAARVDAIQAEIDEIRAEIAASKKEMKSHEP